MGNTEINTKYKRYFRSLSEEDDSDYYNYKEMEDEKRQARSSRKRFRDSNRRLSRSYSNSPKRNWGSSRSRSRSYTRDRRHSRSFSRSPKRSYRYPWTFKAKPTRLGVYLAKYRNAQKLTYKSISDYHCRVCGVYSSSDVDMKQHLQGKRHQFNVANDEEAMSTFKRRKPFDTDSKWRHDMYDELYSEKKISVEETYKRKTNFIFEKKSTETSANCETNNYVGLDYVVVIQKRGKSVFHCCLCDTSTMYDNFNLADHILGDMHQRAYAEQRGPIKIKRLKSRNPEKGSLEKSIEQMLFHRNTIEKISKPKSKTNASAENCDSKPNSDNKSSPSPSSLNGTVSISDDDTSGTFPETLNSARSSIPEISELVEALPLKDIFNLVLLKLNKNGVSNEDVPLLNAVMNETTALVEKLNTTLTKENVCDVEESINEVDGNSSSSDVILLEEISAPFQLDSVPVNEYSDPSAKQFNPNQYLDSLLSTEMLSNILSTVSDKTH